MVKKLHTRKVGFFLEDRLLGVLKKTIASQVCPKNCDIALSFTKFSVGIVIPDLVIVALPKNVYSQRRRSKTPSFFECAVLAEVLRGRSKTSEEVAHALYARQSMVDHAISRLTRLRFMASGKGGELAVDKKIFPKSLRIISIEAKLLRWRDAIAQAKQYLQFSNSAYIALPTTLVGKNAKIKQQCRKEGLGLITVDANRTTVVLKGRIRKVVTGESIWLFRKALSQKGIRPVILSGIQSPPVTSMKRSKL